MTVATEFTRRRVLIVEDRYLIASELAEQVRDLGGEVMGPAPSVEAARSILSEKTADTAPLDVNLEAGLVFPIAEELEMANTPFVLLTAH